MVGLVETHPFPCFPDRRYDRGGRIVSVMYLSPGQRGGTLGDVGWEVVCPRGRTLVSCQWSEE